MSCSKRLQKLNTIWCTHHAITTYFSFSQQLYQNTYLVLKLNQIKNCQPLLLFYFKLLTGANPLWSYSTSIIPVIVSNFWWWRLKLEGILFHSIIAHNIFICSAFWTVYYQSTTCTYIFLTWKRLISFITWTLVFYYVQRYNGKICHSKSPTMNFLLLFYQYIHSQHDGGQNLNQMLPCIYRTVWERTPLSLVSLQRDRPPAIPCLAFSDLDA